MTNRQKRLMIEQLTDTVERLTRIATAQMKEIKYSYTEYERTNSGDNVLSRTFLLKPIIVSFNINDIIGECLRKIAELTKE